LLGYLLLLSLAAKEEREGRQKTTIFTFIWDQSRPTHTGKRTQTHSQALAHKLLHLFACLCEAPALPPKHRYDNDKAKDNAFRIVHLRIVRKSVKISWIIYAKLW